MRDEAVHLSDFLAEYNSTFGSVPDKNDLPFQIVLSKDIQVWMLRAVLSSRESQKEWAAKLVYSNEKEAADFVDWVEGEPHSVSISTKVTADFHYRGTFHDHPPETELEPFLGMGYPPSASDINSLVNVKQNLICIIAADDRSSTNPDIYLLVKTQQSQPTVTDETLLTRVTALALAKSGGLPPVSYATAASAYQAVVLDLCTEAFVGYYWGVLTKDYKGAVILQNFGPEG